MGIKISELPAAQNSTNGDYFIIVQGNTTKKITKELILQAITTSLSNIYTKAEVDNLLNGKADEVDLEILEEKIAEDIVLDIQTNGKIETLWVYLKNSDGDVIASSSIELQTALYERVANLEETINTELEDGTATGESITVNDSTNAYARLDIEGNTSQKQYRGINFLPIRLNKETTKNGITVKYDELSGTISINGTATENANFAWSFDDVQLPATTYVQYNNNFQSSNVQIGFMNGNTTIGTLTFGETNRLYNHSATLGNKTINQCYLLVIKGTTVNRNM